MENMNLVALLAVLLFVIVYLVAFLALDRSSRISGNKSRRAEGVFFSTLVLLILLSLGVSLSPYMGYIIPCAIVSFATSLYVTFSKG